MSLVQFRTEGGDVCDGGASHRRLLQQNASR